MSSCALDEHRRKAATVARRLRTQRRLGGNLRAFVVDVVQHQLAALPVAPDPADFHDPTVHAWGGAARDALFEWITLVIEHKGRHPTDDQLLELCNASFEGENFSDDEIRSFCAFLLYAGIETTHRAMCRVFAALAADPDQWERFRADWGIVSSAVAEIMRFRAPVQGAVRVAFADAEIGDQHGSASDKLVLLLGSANHDEATFPDPKRFDDGRFEGGKHSKVTRIGPLRASGGGEHTCTGSLLTRLEVEQVLVALHDLFESIEFVSPGIGGSGRRFKYWRAMLVDPSRRDRCRQSSRGGPGSSRVRRRPRCTDFQRRQHVALSNRRVDARQPAAGIQLQCDRGHVVESDRVAAFCRTPQVDHFRWFGHCRTRVSGSCAPRRHMSMISGLELSDADTAAILGGNARRIFDLDEFVDRPLRGASKMHEQTEDQLDLRPFPDELRAILAGTRAEAEAFAVGTHSQLHSLHDRLGAIIAALIDDAAERGEPLQPLLDRIVARTSVGVENLVGAALAPETVAALLRTHHSNGMVTDDGDTVSIDRHCRSGLAHWRSHPEVTLVALGEVPGVPGGVPRYSARCIHTIDAFGGGSWRVSPPASSDGTCHWEADRVDPSTSSAANS